MSNSQQEHDEANNFAWALLMPATEFKDYIENVSSNVGDIGEFFQVPSMAVRHRARSLGFSGHGLRDGEPKFKGKPTPPTSI